MAITYRTSGDWGAGKGANLTPEEVDGNFYEIVTRLTDVENNPPEAISIDHFVIEGSLLTIVMSDASEHGPFVLPMAQWRWTGEWQAETQYFIGDLFTQSGNVYFVRVQHVSEVTFDPALFGVDGFVYVLVISKAPQPYDIGLYYNDRIPSGSDVIMLHVAARSFTLPVNFEGSVAFLQVAASETPITLPIHLNGTLIGSLVFTPGSDTTTDGGQFGTYSSVDTVNGVEVVVGDRLTIALPYEDDPSAKGLAVTMTTLAISI